MYRRLFCVVSAAGALAISTSASSQTPSPADAIPAAPQVAAAPQAMISNGLITARILLPDAQKGFYRGSRFDWSGVVQSLVYRGQEFYGPWFDKTSASVRDFAYDGEHIIAGPNTATFGPAEEFDPAGPLGFADAAPGGVFVKIGVGALRKPDAEKYSQFRSYEIVDGGRWSAKAGKDSVAFAHQLDPAAGGYGYAYEKTLRLTTGRPELVIAHRLKNTGTQAFTTKVYNHNFLAFGGGGIGEGLSIEAPFAITSSKPPAPEAASISRKRIDYLKPLRDRDRVFFPIEGFGPEAQDNAIKVSDARRGASVAFKGDHPLAQLPLWSIRSVVAIEPFITLTVEPGQEVTWAYVYEYDARG